MHVYNATEHAPRVNTSASGQSAHQNAHNQECLDKLVLKIKRKTLTKKKEKHLQGAIRDFTSVAEGIKLTRVVQEILGQYEKEEESETVTCPSGSLI